MKFDPVGGETLKSRVAQLPDSDLLVLPVLGWMRSLRHGPSLAEGGRAVTSTDGGLSARAGSRSLGLSIPGGDARGHQLSRDGGLLSWRSSLSPGVLGAAGAWLREAALLPVQAELDVTGVTTPATSSAERDPGSHVWRLFELSRFATQGSDDWSFLSVLTVFHSEPELGGAASSELGGWPGTDTFSFHESAALVR